MFTWFTIPNQNKYWEKKKKQATEKWNIFCCISKQKMWQSSVIETLQQKPVSPEETQGVKTQDLV